MKRFFKFLRNVYGTPKAYNVLCELDFRYQKVEQLIEFTVLAYNEKEASLIGKKLISKFNTENGCHIRYDKLWKIKTNITYRKSGEVTSIDSMLENKIKFSTSELESLVIKNTLNKFEEVFDDVFKTDNPKRYIRN